MKIETFFDLYAWQEGHKLVLMVYELVKKFPRNEQYALSDQLRRCVVSVTSNVAEGFSRRTARDKIQFYSISLGSITELQNQIVIARDVGFCTREECGKVMDQSIVVHKLVRGLLKATPQYVI